MSSTIVEDYESSIRELTFNSRPIIDNLTIIAKENTHEAAGILKAIIDRIYKCIPEQKLFALYLLDSVCKIVGPPYTDLVGPEIFKLFSHVYLLVSDSTRAKLVKIYELWRVTRTKGSADPLFPPEQLDRIGGFLTQAGYRKAPPQPAISAASLTADIDALLPALQHKMTMHANDLALAGKASALVELRSLLHAHKLSQNELLGIQAKLSAMKKQELSAPVPASVPPKPASAGGNGMEQFAVGPESAAAAAANASVPQAEALFNGLVASGLVKVDQSLKPGSKPEYELVLPKQKYSPGSRGMHTTNALEQLLLDANAAGKSQYEQIKFKELVKVAQRLAPKEGDKDDKDTYAARLQKFVSSATLDPSTVQVLYEVKASKCSQCGKRFTADDAGAAKKRMHLDWHFRINKKQANFKANVQSRNWYLDDHAWERFCDDDLLEFESTSSQAKEVARPESAPKAAYVVIPATETNMNNTCVICREQVKATYNDVLGEWVWDGCMVAPGDSKHRIMHVACFDEASRKRGATDDDRAVKRERLQ